MLFSFRQFLGEYKKTIMILALLIVLIMLGLLIGGYFYIANNLQPVDDISETIVEIPSGSNLTQIAETLEDEEIVRNASIFRYYARFTGYNGNLQAGEYMFSGEVSPDDILEKIARGDVVDSSVKFTIPEGLRADQVAERLDNQGLGDKDKFMELMDDREKWDYWFLGEVDENSKIFLEGYLFPDTYRIEADASEQEVIETMLNQFDENFSNEFRELKEGLKFNIDELMTLASIVEREAVLTEEQEKIAGVFYNRLSSEIYLEACATVEYVLQENKPVLSDEDTEIETPYNTYQNSGLPPGPIASPGLSAIEAALEPAEHDYMFFVARHDGSRSHVFSETYQEHENAKEKIRSED